MKKSFSPRPAAPIVLAAAIAVASLALSAPCPGREAPKDERTAAEIQALVRYSHSLQNVDLNGLLRSSSTRARVPFALSIRGNVIQFGFADPSETITLLQKPGGYELTQTLKGKNHPIPAEKFAEPVRGTDVTYEDLSMRFLYWPNVKLLGREVVRNRVAWKLHIINPNRSGPYSQVYIWVDTKSGGMMKLEGYGWGGADNRAHKIKMFAVVSGQKINGSWVLKKMNVETFDPVKGKVVSRTSLELREKKR